MLPSLWAAATLGHFLLTARWVARCGWGGPTRDGRWFATMVAATGTLAIALHVVAASVGLSVAAVATLLGLGHLLVAAHVRRRSGTTTSQRATGEPDALATLVLESAAVVVLTAITIRWVLIAAPTIEVSGTDAAHYHVPNAVNFALGTSPFDLPATSHLYPMGSAMLAAWFILPFGDALLIDLTMIIPFLLLLSGLGWLFRLTTGASGLAWATWPMLVLFATELFRAASLISADLMFAASFTALAAALFATVFDRRVSAEHVVLTALLAGLLLGTKTTGLAAALVLAIWAVCGAVLGARSRQASAHDRPRVATWAAAVVLVVGAGGIWLVRNWWLWGSPVAPQGLSVFGIELFRGVTYERSTYLSVLGDIRKDASYPLGERFMHYARTWLGSWYLAALAPIVLVPVDALVSWLRRPPVRPAAVRLGLLTIVLGTIVPMAWLLVGAPWTSLEWTRGFALRYAQPWWALLPLVALVGLFPASLPWYRSTVVALGVGATSGVVALAALQAARGPLFPPAPTLASVGVAVLAWACWRVFRWRRDLLVVSGVVILSTLFGVWTSRLDTAARRQAVEAAGAAPARPVDRIYAQARRWEEERGFECRRRRFFVMTRLDEPLGLQEVVYANLVFYAWRDVAVTARAKPLGRCDYVINSRERLESPKGVQLLSVLSRQGAVTEIGEDRPFVLYGNR